MTSYILSECVKHLFPYSFLTVSRHEQGAKKMLCLSPAVAPMLNTVLVGETVAGTVMSLVGSVSLGPVVDTGVSLSAQWTSQGQTLTVSTTNTTTLTFEPLSQTDSSDYVYMVTVEPDNSTYVESNSASQSINLTVQPYPDLVAKICVLCGECMTQGMTTLTGDVSLHPNTSPNYSLAYLWRDPSGDLITESSHSDLVVEEERLIVRDVERNEGDYSLTACLTVPGSDVVDHCSQETVQSISAISKNSIIHTTRVLTRIQLPSGRMQNKFNPPMDAG